jgi:exopolysaccharide biosynthesis polyprenyl glycosylphosphotransferase
VVGLADVRDEESWDADDGDTAWLERPTDLADVCREKGVERLILAYCNMTPEQQLEAVQTGKLLGVKISVLPRLFEVTGPAVEVDGIEGMTLLGLRGFARTKSSMFLKRVIDVMASVVGLFVLLPLLAGVAVAIKLNSKGPVLYAQARVGRHNRPFRLYKFRTMVAGADASKADLAHLNEARRPMFKIGDDPRITRVGRFLRRTSLDELPQLWNVLKGEMSLVGPRPLVPDEDAHVIGWHRERLKLTPGLTGPWQVLGRTAIPFDEMIQLDYLYVAEWSLWNDFKVLARTVPVVLRARGA